MLSIQSEDYPWLEHATILFGPRGSRAHGTNTEESDFDYAGIVIPPKSYYLGLDSFNGFDTTGGKNFKSTFDTKDVTITHINKFVKEAMTGDPNVLDLLFLDPDQIIYKTHLGQMLIDHRHLFLSQHLKTRYAGFARNQMSRMEKTMSVVPELARDASYDTKAFMTGIRLMTSVIDILITGDYTTRRPNADVLLRCRNREFTYQQALDMYKDCDDLLAIAGRNTALPKTVDRQKIDKLLIEINEHGLALFD